MNPSDEKSRDPLERVAAYVLDELSAEEKAAFERRMTADESLRREVEATRDALNETRAWLDAPPPGIDRAKELEIPSTRTQSSSPHRSQVVPLHPVVRRIAAAAAIFLIGFGFGRVVDWGRSGQGTVVSVVRPSDRSNQPTAPILPADAKPTVPESSPAPPPATATPSASPIGRALARAEATPRRTYSDNGKLVIETTLAGSGASALWVVDAGFRLDNNHDRQ